MNWTDEIISDVLDRFSAGETMKAALARHGVDWTAWCRLTRKRPELREQWHEARKEGCHAVMEELRELGAPASYCADDGTTRPHVIADPARLRVALDALKFYVSRVNRDAYGDSIDMHVRGTIDLIPILAQANERLARFRAAQRLEAQDAELIPAVPAQIGVADLL